VKSDIQTLMDNQQRLLQLLNETSTYHLGTMVRKVVRNTSVLHGSLGLQVKTTHTGTVVRERCKGNDAGTVRENVCNNSKNVKSHVFLDFEKKRKKT